jgi:hypothetical protein
MMAPGVDKKSRSKDVISREYTINLHKALHGVTFKKRAPKAVRAVRVRPGEQAAVPERRSRDGGRARRGRAGSRCPEAHRKGLRITCIQTRSRSAVRGKRGRADGL